MSFELTIRNYRCFQEPFTLSIDSALIALIGINNAGKSSILRFFYECRSIFEQLVTALENENLDGLISYPANPPNQPFTPVNTVLDYHEMFCDFNDGDIEFVIRWVDECVNMLEPHEMSIVITMLRARPSWHAQLLIDKEPFSRSDLGKIRSTGEVIEWGSQLSTSRERTHAIFQSLVNMQYVGSFRNILNANLPGTGNKNYFDLEMGALFVGRWRRLKNGNRLEYALSARVTEDIRRIFGYRTLEINPWLDDHTLQVIVNSRSYKLGELGSGMAQFIVVLANAALSKPAYILIDEPELNLHPSLQSDFLTSLASYASEGVFYATHNAGLALSCADRIYTVRRTESTSKVSVYEQTPHLSEFLGELGYAAYKDLGFDKILLVEGPSEVKLIGCWLRLYNLSHKVVLLHLGGSSSINGHSDAELQEIKRLSENVFALVDSERDDPDAPLSPDREAFVTLCKQTNIQCFVTERRATENYLTDQAIKSICGQEFRALDEFESLKSARHKWKKSQNWRIGAKMTIEDLRKTDLHDVFMTLCGDSANR